MVFDCFVEKQSQIPYWFNIGHIVTAPIISLISSSLDGYMFKSCFFFSGLKPYNKKQRHKFITAPLGSIRELPALSCHAIKLSEGKDTISKK